MFKKNFIDHFSGPGSAICPSCVCVRIYVLRITSNRLTFDLDICRGDLS